MGLDAGVYLYHPPSHTLQKQARGDCTKLLEEIIPELDSDTVDQAGACIALVVSLSRLKNKYGDRSYRFALLEAGHIAQNLLLASTAEGVAALPVGGFIEDKLNALLGLDGRQEFAVYLVMFGGSPENGYTPSNHEPPTNTSIGQPA